MSLGLEPDDDEYGSISFAATVPAAGLRVTLIRPYPEPPLGVYLNDDGCVEFPTQFNAGHSFIWYPEAIVGDEAGTSHPVRVKVFETTVQDNADQDLPTAVLVPPIADGASVLHEVEPAALQLTSILAIATAVIRRLHSMPDSPLEDGAQLRLFRDDLALNGDLAKADAIRLGVDSGNEKFLIAHEMGHWFQSLRSRQLGDDGAWAFNYDWPVVSPNCDFLVEDFGMFHDEPNEGSNQHGIRSAEFSSGSMPEGFGHFVASVAFNTTPQEDAAAPEGIFHYYKNIDIDAVPAYEDFVDPMLDDLRVQLDGGALSSTWGGASRWVDLQCDVTANVGDWDPPGTTWEVTSEIDWLRFFWQFHTADVTGTSKPGFWDVVELVAYTQSEHPWQSSAVWNNLLVTLQDAGSGLTAYEDRLDPLNTANGVFNDAQ
jgi:hypothetical protein